MGSESAIDAIPDSRCGRAGWRRALRVDRGRALEHGLRVHGTSIPGVAQRTGSTTYYVELYDAPEAPDAEEPAFSLYPVPGALDVLVAPEFLEVGRMIELGFVSPLRTTVVASTQASTRSTRRSPPGARSIRRRTCSGRPRLPPAGWLRSTR